MTKKKTPVKTLRKHIASLVKEELQRVLKEESETLFDKIPKSQKEAFKAWIMRQYFNPVKHGDKSWFDDSVTEENVLDYITSPRGKKVFPTSPRNLVGLWNSKQYLQKRLGAAVDELEGEDSEEVEYEKAKYQTGDVSLKDIGKELGGVTPTMINKLAASSMGKLAKLTGGVHPEELDDEELEGFLKKIKNAREEGAIEFAEKLHNSDSVKDFLHLLASQHILTPTDLKIITPEELEGLEILRRKPKNNVVLILLQDIEDEDNLFKTYQSLVSKKVFPPAKRGRPKKKKY